MTFPLFATTESSKAFVVHFGWIENL